MNKTTILLKKIAEYVLLLLTAILVFVIQTSIFPLIPFFNGSPNLMLFMTFITGFIYGEGKGMYVGLICGILSDIFYTGKFGYFSLIYITLGYANGIIHHFFYDDNIGFTIVLSIVNSLIFNLYIYFTSFFVNGDLNFLNYFFNICMPSIIMTLIFAILFYPMAFRLKNKKAIFEE